VNLTIAGGETEVGVPRVWGATREVWVCATVDRRSHSCLLGDKSPSQRGDSVASLARPPRATEVRWTRWTRLTCMGDGRRPHQRTWTPCSAVPPLPPRPPLHSEPGPPPPPPRRLQPPRCPAWRWIGRRAISTRWLQSQSQSYRRCQRGRNRLSRRVRRRTGGRLRSQTNQPSNQTSGTTNARSTGSTGTAISSTPWVALLQHALSTVSIIAPFTASTFAVHISAHHSIATTAAARAPRTPTSTTSTCAAVRRPYPRLARELHCCRTLSPRHHHFTPAVAS
jgi:hypothetical protein